MDWYRSSFPSNEQIMKRSKLLTNIVLVVFTISLSPVLISEATASEKWAIKLASYSSFTAAQKKAAQWKDCDWKTQINRTVAPNEAVSYEVCIG